MNYSDWQMMEIVVDNGSMSTACPPWLEDDLTIDESQRVQLVDIQKQCRSRATGRGEHSLFIEGYGEDVGAGGVRRPGWGVSGVEPGVYPKGKTLVLRVSERWKDNFHTKILAPVDEETASAEVPSDGSG